MDEATKKIRNFVYGSVETHMRSDTPVSESTMSLFVLLQILDMLDSIDSRLIAVENAVESAGSGISDLKYGRV